MPPFHATRGSRTAGRTFTTWRMSYSENRRPLFRDMRSLVHDLLPHQPAALAIPVALALGLTLVVQLLALGECDLDLGAALLVEIELERNEGHALALDRAHELVDLPLVQEELARTFRRVVEAAGLQIFRHVGVDQPDLAAARVGVGHGDRRLARAQRLHLAAGQRNAGLEHLADMIVEARLAIIGDHLQGALAFLASHADQIAIRQRVSYGPSARRGFR